ncbi:hypothetical protein TSACC_21703 [Terrimicrobium sacchariphilum]|uniref:Uncharacterized protein n=1 Tax=Terrimicrobium sacchariphilum TaxID=690879 RepID=A0A146G6U4_TERSA|nr:hypothetical protein [Terrimicrobium sacchariphilum]GAT33290.1 hypothetical protein TSACC_21703 [Terrimicrobium sacchariphilum]
MKIKHSMMFFEGETATAGGGGGAATTTETGGGSLISDGSAGQQQTEATPWVGADGAFSEGWTNRLPEDLGDYRASLGKFKNVGDMAKSYRELETKLGVKGTFIPGKDAKPEEVAAYRKAVGIPDEPTKYNIKPEQLPDGFTWPADEAIKPILEVAHRHNIPEAALRELIGANIGAQAAASAELAKAQLEEGKAQLQREWGDKFGANIQRAAAAAKLAGVDPNSVGFTDPEVVKAVVALAAKISDDQFVTSGGTGSGSKGGVAEAREIQTNPDHPKYKAYQEGDADTVAYVRGLLQRG